MKKEIGGGVVGEGSRGEWSNEGGVLALNNEEKAMTGGAAREVKLRKRQPMTIF